jgi:hypothetical protein
MSSDSFQPGDEVLIHSIGCLYEAMIVTRIKSKDAVERYLVQYLHYRSKKREDVDDIILKDEESFAYLLETRTGSFAKLKRPKRIIAINRFLEEYRCRNSVENCSNDDAPNPTSNVDVSPFHVAIPQSLVNKLGEDDTVHSVVKAFANHDNSMTDTEGIREKKLFFCAFLLQYFNELAKRGKIHDEGVSRGGDSQDPSSVYGAKWLFKLFETLQCCQIPLEDMTVDDKEQMRLLNALCNHLVSFLADTWTSEKPSSIHTDKEAPDVFCTVSLKGAIEGDFEAEASPFVPQMADLSLRATGDTNAACSESFDPIGIEKCSRDSFADAGSEPTTSAVQMEIPSTTSTPVSHAIHGAADSERVLDRIACAVSAIPDAIVRDALASTLDAKRDRPRDPSSTQSLPSPKRTKIYRHKG